MARFPPGSDVMRAPPRLSLRDPHCFIPILHPRPRPLPVSPSLLSIALLGLALPHARFLRRQDEQITRTEYVLLLVFFLLAVGIVTVGYLYQLNYERRYRQPKWREPVLSAIAELKVSELVQYRKSGWGRRRLLQERLLFEAWSGAFPPNSRRTPTPDDRFGRGSVITVRNTRTTGSFCWTPGGVTRDSVPERRSRPIPPYRGVHPKSRGRSGGISGFLPGRAQPENLPRCPDSHPR